ncbi:arylesterase [Pontibacter korlensis]|uniref:GDSL family lipase n=1 Tax=Pontibacter korlensis TaxID=400092 RepID=A0A0E3UXZ5_9BACT|nr:arylesterase [Pontibacter korlensis]AKD04687.1 GDSL family lipase [Pontibacter korlensis]
MTIKNQFLTLGIAVLAALSGCGDTATNQKINQEQEARSTDRNSKKPAAEAETKTILFFGNSLTAGYGLDDPGLAFPALIQQRIDSLDLPYRAINAGLSGETTAGGKNRIDWLLNKQPVDVFVLELGANDGLRGIDPEETYSNLKTIIEKVRAKNPKVEIVLAGMQVPPSMGQEYSQKFREVFTRVAEEENVALIPFLLEGVGGEPKLNQADGVHPTEEGQKILAKNVWQVLEPILEEQAGV